MLNSTLKNTRQGSQPGNDCGGFGIATIEHPSPGFYIMEIWKDVEGYGGCYQISNHGNAKSFRQCRYGKLLKFGLTSSGYPAISPHKDKKQKTMAIHRIVAKSFIPNPDNKPHVNHKDGNKQNNHVSNLEWVTPKENHAHASKNGLLACGERQGASKLNSFQVRVIRKTTGLTQRELARIFKISQGTSGPILLRKTWRHLS